MIQTDLPAEATRDISGGMNAILADASALFLKTNNFHWHLRGPYFREYHMLFDEQADQLLAMTDPIAERVRRFGGPNVRSIRHVARVQRVLNNDAKYLEPTDMLSELCEDNRALVERLRQALGVCESNGDIAAASLIEVWIDETERRAWLLYQATRAPESGE